MTKYGVGQPVRRTEDPRLLTGRGKFNDDYIVAVLIDGHIETAYLFNPSKGDYFKFFKVFCWHSACISYFSTKNVRSD